MDDLESITKFIARDNPGAATKWVERIEEMCLAIAANPETGQAMETLGPLVRASVIGRYMVFHRFIRGRLEILRVIPGGRDVTSL